MVEIQIRNQSTGSWEVVKQFPTKYREEPRTLFGFIPLPPRIIIEVRLRDCIIAAVAEAKQHSGEVRVIDDCPEEYCVFWLNGKWLVGANEV